MRIEVLSRSSGAGRRFSPLGKSGPQRPNIFPEEKQREKSEQGEVKLRAACGEKAPSLPVVGPWDAGFVEVRSQGPPPPPHLRLSAFSIKRRHCGVCDNDAQILRNNLLNAGPRADLLRL